MTVRILVGDVRSRLAELPDDSVHCVVTSPPYFGLRDYGVEGQIGLEPTLADYLATMVAVFREVRRVLRPDGTLWLNIGDSYAGGGGYYPDAPSNQIEAAKERGAPGAQINGSRIKGQRSLHGLKQKDLMMVPARLAIALCDDGWYLRSDIIWHKRAPMPESVTDRPTSAHEHIFLLTKQSKYFYDQVAVAEDTDQPERIGKIEYTFSNSDPASTMRQDVGRSVMRTATRNQRNVWTLSPEPFPEAHFATFPTEIPRRAIKAGTSEKGACAACGAPWIRTTEKQPTGDMQRKGASWDLGDGAHGSFHRNGRAPVVEYAPVTATITTGWQPSCACDAAVVPCRVLDPFGGAGTTGLVADELGRDCTLIELNPEYAQMARNRIYGAAPMFAAVDVA